MWSKADICASWGRAVASSRSPVRSFLSFGFFLGFTILLFKRLTHRNMKSTYCTAISRSDDIPPGKGQIIRCLHFRQSLFSPPAYITHEGSNNGPNVLFQPSIILALSLSRSCCSCSSWQTGAPDLYREVGWSLLWPSSFKLTTGTCTCNVQCTGQVFNQVFLWS